MTSPYHLLWAHGKIGGGGGDRGRKKERGREEGRGRGNRERERERRAKYEEKIVEEGKKSIAAKYDEWTVYLVHCRGIKAVTVNHTDAQTRICKIYLMACVKNRAL